MTEHPASLLHSAPHSLTLAAMLDSLALAAMLAKDLVS